MPRRIMLAKNDRDEGLRRRVEHQFRISVAHCDTTVVKMLVGNKCDLDNIRDVSIEEGAKLAEAEGLFFMETSALDSTNVNKAFEIVIVKSTVMSAESTGVASLIYDLLAEGLIMNDAFQVAAIVEKLPPLWKDFKNYLKHKHKEMTIEDLIVRLHIEEDNKATERSSKGISTMNEAHIVEDGQNNSKKRKKVEHGSNQPKKKFNGKCFNCGKIGHKSIDCRAPKKGKKKDQANIIESNKENDDLCVMFTECNLVGNPREWWMDSGATRHVCANKELFLSFSPAQAEEMLYMANSATAKVEGT
ncbi:Ras-related protein RABA5c [Capsicum baccatum]|uniref:Ras-related protein RABA5c n=1 Tax=Capsicum baccatum TaxID=33114 RepID=A0A2G2W1R2_CAPBA|nr:Ras-related protein RABA5c [Capsicum baccatum]